MKKLFALALVLALSACAGLAELADAFPAVTVTGEMTIDCDAAHEALEDIGLQPEQVALWDGLLTRLSGARDALVIADEGIEYSMTQSDGKTLFIAGESRDGRVSLVSSLFPNYSLTGEASGITWQDIAAAAEAVVGSVNQTIDDVAAAVKPDVPEFGEYEIDGETFNMCIPLTVDVEAMAEAGVTLARSLMANETLREAGLDGLPEPWVEASALPTVTAARYSADGASATVYTAELTSAAEQPLTVAASVRLDGDDVRVRIVAPGKALEIVGAYAPTEDGAGLRLDVHYNGNDYALTVDARTEAAAAMTTTLTVNGRVLATEVNTFAMDGERTIDTGSEGRLALDIQDVVNNRNGAGTRLFMDLMAGSLLGV